MIVLLQQKFDYVIDAIDSITPKVHLIKTSLEMGHNLVSSMGAGGKMDPTQLKVLDISKTCHCPMAYYLRKRLKEVGIKKV
jgi:tRNA A37 threonylcarbamoyladenosine dehydratase